MSFLKFLNHRKHFVIYCHRSLTTNQTLKKYVKLSLSFFKSIKKNSGFLIIEIRALIQKFKVDYSLSI